MQTNIRLFRIQTDCSLKRLMKNASAWEFSEGGDIISIDHTTGKDETAFDILFRRSIYFSSREADGGLVVKAVDSVEKIRVRFFESKKDLILAAINPPRGSKYVDQLLEIVLSGYNFFYELLEITQSVIKRHVARFEVAKLVSAKVRDFSVYEGAIARLEITSKNGLKSEIAPFLSDRTYKLDSATYEVTDKFASFLVTYANTGTLKVNEHYLESVLRRFVALL